MENGSWRLEDNEKCLQSTTPTVIPPSTGSSQPMLGIKKDGKKKKLKDSDENGSTENMLLRRPSIKKIRALFQKDASSPKLETADQENSAEVLSALSKLPKVETVR